MNRKSRKNLELKAVLEWDAQSSSFLAHYGQPKEVDLEGMSIQWTPSGKLPNPADPLADQLRSVLPLSSEGTARRFLAWVEERSGEVEEAGEPLSPAVESVLQELSDKFQRLQLLGEKVNWEEFIEEHLSQLGSKSSTPGNVLHDIRQEALRGCGVQLGANLANLMAHRLNWFQEYEQFQEPAPPQHERLEPVPPILVTCGAELATMLEYQEGQELHNYWERCRQDYSARYGVLIPPLALRSDPSLEPRRCNVLVGTLLTGSFLHHPDKILAMGSPGHLLDFQGYELYVDGWNRPIGLWLEEAELEEPELQGLQTCTNGPAVLATQILLSVGRHLGELLTYQEAVRLLEGHYDSAVYRELVPEHLDNCTIWMVLKRLVEESFSIRDLNKILETLLLWANDRGGRRRKGRLQDLTEELTEACRLALAPAFLSRLSARSGEVVVWAVPEEFWPRPKEPVDPALWSRLELVRHEFWRQGELFLVVVPAMLRAAFSRQCRWRFPDITVFSYEELGGRPVRRLELNL